MEWTRASVNKLHFKSDYNLFKFYSDLLELYTNRVKFQATHKSSQFQSPTEFRDQVCKRERNSTNLALFNYDNRGKNVQ